MSSSQAQHECTIIFSISCVYSNSSLCEVEVKYQCLSKSHSAFWEGSTHLHFQVQQHTPIFTIDNSNGRLSS